MRAATESLIKLIFITSAEDSEQEERIREFWHDLAEINRIKQSEQAKLNLRVLDNRKSDILALSPIVLTLEEEEHLRKKWSKKSRRKLEQKWSFSEIVISLATNYKDKTVEQFKGLLHSYRNASHVAHGDETGILIIKERAGRNETERNIADFAHYIRLISDCFIYSIMTAMATMDYLKLEKSFFYDQVGISAEVRDLADAHVLKLYDDEFYDKYRDNKFEE